MAPPSSSRIKTRSEFKVKYEENKKVQCEENKKFQCQKCKRLYLTERTLWTHVVNVHRTRVPSMYKGRITADLFFQTVNYDDHVVFLRDERRMKTNKKYTPINDDAIGAADADKYQEGPLKECRCFPSCQRSDCCGEGQPCYKTCACHCLADDDEVVALFSGISKCDLTLEQKKIYAYQYWQREGFDMAYADYFRKHLGHLRHMMHCLPLRLYPTPVSVSDDERHDSFRKFAVLAIKRYNQRHLDTYKCVQLLGVNAIYGGEFLYFITFVAVCDKIAVPQVFQAKLSFSYEGINGELHVTRVLFCRLKPDQSSSVVSNPIIDQA